MRCECIDQWCQCVSRYVLLKVLIERSISWLCLCLELERCETDYAAVRRVILVVIICFRVHPIASHLASSLVHQQVMSPALHRRVVVRRVEDVERLHELANKLGILQPDDDVHVGDEEQVLLDEERSRLETHGAPTSEDEREVSDEEALQAEAVVAAIAQTLVRADVLHRCEKVAERYSCVAKYDGVDRYVTEQARPYETRGQVFKVDFRAKRVATQLAVMFLVTQSSTYGLREVPA